MKNLLLHNKLYLRFIGLFSTGLILFIIAWIIGYNYLPEGVLRGASAAARLAGTEKTNLYTEFIKIASINLFMGSLIVLANTNLKINGYPLGYLIPLLWIMHYGILLGTNSFQVLLPERMAPSLAVLKRSGLYEIAAYCLLAVATNTFPRYKIERIFLTNPEKIDSKDRPKMKFDQKIGIVLGVIILLAANFGEAIMITVG